MTTFVNFVPSQSSAFQTQVTLDGVVYTLTVTWNLFSQRYYINVNTLSGALVLSLPLVGSPVGVTLASLSWAFGIVTATTTTPHGYEEGSTVALTLSGSDPDAYNGEFLCLITGDSTFTYPLASFPGFTASVGNVNFNIDFLDGYFDANGQPFVSTLVYRIANQQFEVNP